MTKSKPVCASGPLASHVEGFRKHLVGQGYRPSSVRRQEVLMGQVSCWLARRKLTAADLTGETVGRFLRTRRSEGHATTQPVSLLVEYLRSAGIAAAAAHCEAGSAASVLLQRYERYLFHERGLSAGTVSQYLRPAGAFLAQCSSAGGLGMEVLTAGEVTEFLVSECRRWKTDHAKSVATALRVFLRFLYAEGLTPNLLAGAVPSVANRRGASLPKGISADAVLGLLKSCDRRTVVGRRDFAILTVLSRLGLRASEVASLRLGDLDWRNGEIIVRGKGNRKDRLPMPTDVGEAIVGWLQHGRPRCDSPCVFTRVRAPYRGLSVPGLSMIVASACNRADLPVIHAHRLRHTAATEMLRAGASLAEVGQVLRHRSPEVTALYAKVDQNALSALVRSWPGGAA